MLYNSLFSLPQIHTCNMNISMEKLGPSKLLEVKGGGRLVIGQNLGSIDGDFNVLEALDGDIADYRLYDAALSAEQLKEWNNCKDQTITLPPLVSLDNGVLIEVGDVVLSNITVREVCGGNFANFYLFFTEKMDFQRARSWCNTLEGKLSLPATKSENERMWTSANNNKDKCSDNWTYLNWLGIVGDPRTSTWMKSLDNESIAYSNLLSIYQSPSEQYKCVATVSHNKYKWAASSCDMETCVMCSFRTFPTLRLRGLCKVSLLDRTYSFRGNAQHRLTFDGLSHVQILKVNGSWMMTSRRYSDLYAKMLAKVDGEYPIGVHSWEVFGDKCQDRKVSFWFYLLL